MSGIIPTVPFETRDISKVADFEPFRSPSLTNIAVKMSSCKRMLTQREKGSKTRHQFFSFSIKYIA